MAEWEVWLSTSRGTRLALLDKLESGRAIKVANNRGACSLMLPDDYDALLGVDNLIEIWRKPQGGALRLFNTYFVRGIEYLDRNGRDQTKVTGYDGNDLAFRRIVAYSAGSTNAGASAEAADDLLKRVVRYNCATAATDTDRDLSALGLTVAADVTAAPTVSMGFAWRYLPDLFKDVCEASREAGTNLYWEFAPTVQSDGTLGFDFRTYTDQPGADLTGAQQVFFGRDFGNLTGATAAYNYADEVTVIYSGGQGQETDRIVEEVEDTARSGASPWNRREAFYNASAQSTTAAIVAAGEAQLEARRPRLTLSGDLVDTAQARLGVDWNWGDRVVVSHRGRQHDAVITALDLSYAGGKEDMRATFEVQE